MTAVHDVSNDLGPATEARFAAAFETAAVLPAKAASELLGLDVRTLNKMTEAGSIRSVPRGDQRGYTERDCRRYLIEGPSTPCAKAETQKRTTTTATNVRQVNFSDRKTRRR